MDTKYYIAYLPEWDIEEIKPIYELKAEDIDEEQGEVYVNGEEVFFISENSNYYGDEYGNDFCEPGDLVFEVMGEHVFYRPGINCAAGCSNYANDELIGTMEEIENYKTEYGDEIMENNTIKLNESQLREIVSECVNNVLKETDINEISANFLRRASDAAFKDMNRNWNDDKIRTKRGKQWKNFSGEAIKRDSEEKDSVCPSVPESELGNMPSGTYVVMNGDGRDAVNANFRSSYSGHAGTKEQCQEYVNRFYDMSSNWEYLPSILPVEDYLREKNNSIRLNENALRQIVVESVKKLLKEYDDGTYYGGGLPDRYFNDEEPEDYGVTHGNIKELKTMSNRLYDIANNVDGDTGLLYDAAKSIDTYVSHNSLNEVDTNDVGDLLGTYDGDSSSDLTEIDSGEIMLNQILKWRNNSWINESQADEIRDIIGI